MIGLVAYFSIELAFRLIPNILLIVYSKGSERKEVGISFVTSRKGLMSVSELVAKLRKQSII